MLTVVSGLKPQAPNPSFYGAGYWAFLWLQPILWHSISTNLISIHVTDKMEPSNRIATKHMRAAPKLMPPILLCWPTTSEANVVDMAVQVEPFRQYSVKFRCRATDDSSGAV